MSRNITILFLILILSTLTFPKTETLQVSYVKTKAECDNARGVYPNLENIFIIDKDINIVNNKREPVLYFRKNIIPNLLEWTRLLEDVPLMCHDRAKAAGPLSFNKLPPLAQAEQWHQINPFQAVKVINGQQTQQVFANGKRSTTVGLLEPNKFTTWTIDHFDKYENIVIPFIELLSTLFHSIAPEWHQAHEKILHKVPSMRMGRSAFNTAKFFLGTPNTPTEMCNDSITAIHFDGGLASRGTTLLAILGNDIVGSELVFPQYGIALKLQAGDILLMKGHKEYHGNTPLVSGKKLVVNPMLTDIVQELSQSS